MRAHTHTHLTRTHTLVTTYLMDTLAGIRPIDIEQQHSIIARAPALVATQNRHRADNAWPLMPFRSHPKRRLWWAKANASALEATARETIMSYRCPLP